MERAKLHLGNKLIEMGIAPSLVGFAYIISSVEYLIENRNAPAMSMYQYVADKHGTSPHCVERSIRHALSQANLESESHCSLFGGLKKKTNTSCLAILAWEVNNFMGLNV